MRSSCLLLSVLVVACGSSPQDGSDDDTTTTDGGAGADAFAPRGDAGPGGAGDTLDTATGCAGVFNPDQMLDLALDLPAGDWNTVVADSTNSVYVQAQLSCGGSSPILVGVRRKRSGGAPKVGLKIDVNLYVAGQSFAGLKKLSLENGISEGSSTGSARDLVAEYLGWRLMASAGAITSRAAFVRLTVNGQVLGVYVNVEEVDKRFLRDRFGDDSGWLYKKSGSTNDGYHTNETQPNPYAAYFCFWEKNGCAAPAAAELRDSLPTHLAVEQMLRVGAVNALIGNTDSPLLKDNNYLFYDWAGGPRQYFPWDLDTTMRSAYDVFSGTVSGGTPMYVDVLLGNWSSEYTAVLEELLTGPLTLAVIQAELARAQSVAGAALDEDSYSGGGAASAVSDLGAWWNERHAAVTQEVMAR
jgi:hypothetical protein